MPTTRQINQQSVDILTGPRFLESYFAGIIHMPGKGVNEGFSEDTSAATVRVVRQSLPGFDPRRLGATANGGNFNNEDAGEPTSVEYDLLLTEMYDRNMDIAEVTTDMFSLPVVEQTMDNMAGEVNTAVNASTTAEQIKGWANNAASKNGKAKSVALPANITETSYRDAVLSAGAILDDGDEDVGVQTYPADMRQIVARPTFCSKLLTAKNIVVGGDLSVALLERGVISEGTYKGNGNLYVGEIDNTPVYKAPSIIWNKAAEELVYSGTTAKSGNMKNTATAKAEIDKIEALVVSGVGTLRGIATGNRIKSIPSPRGAGIRLQPKFRWGVECIYGTSIVPIVSNGFAIDSLVPEGKTLARLPVGSQTA
ncbi:MAG: hypothetical protein IJX39_08750 [Clostridia bacterium]|nr:hypothetical protein [Clostridia bacterium]